jgi:hypothetical protein
MMEKTQQTGATRDDVPGGTRILDAYDPAWAFRVNPDELDMEWHGKCLLSQLFGSYDEGIRQLDIGPLLIEAEFAGISSWDSYGWQYGCTISPATPTEEIRDAFAGLTDAWKKVIAHKRQAPPGEGKQATTEGL